MPLINEFNQNITWLVLQGFNLPFEFGGATQSGKSKDYNNNQDSISIVALENKVLGVVCDGCATSKSGFSNNEVGSRLIAVLVTRIVWNLLNGKSFSQIPKKLVEIEQEIGKNLLEISNIFTNEDLRTAFIESFFMSTIIAFAVDEKEYLVFGCGDGFLFINGKPTNLDTYEGEYLPNHLIKQEDYLTHSEKKPRSLKVYEKGKTKDLNNLLIATDGFIDIQEHFSELLEKFICSSEEEPLNPGYNKMIAAQFRKNVWFQPSVEEWAETQNGHDDRSFVLLRRFTVKKEEEVRICSKLHKEKPPNQEVS